MNCKSCNFRWVQISVKWFHWPFGAIINSAGLAGRKALVASAFILSDIFKLDENLFLLISPRIKLHQILLKKKYMIYSAGFMPTAQAWRVRGHAASNTSLLRSFGSVQSCSGGVECIMRGSKGFKTDRQQRSMRGLKKYFTHCKPGKINKCLNLMDLKKFRLYFIFHLKPACTLHALRRSKILFVKIPSRYKTIRVWKFIKYNSSYYFPGVQYPGQSCPPSPIPPAYGRRALLHA